MTQRTEQTGDEGSGGPGPPQDSGEEAETGSGDSALEPRELSLDVVFEVLRNRRRRHVLRYLGERDDEVVSLGDLAEHVAALENQKSVGELTSEERKRVYVGLYQCHLPKMDDMDVVEYNQSRGLVELTRESEQIEQYLEATQEEDTREWPRYYAGVAVVGFVVFLGIASGVLPAWVSPDAVLGIVTVAFATGAVAQMYATRSE